MKDVLLINYTGSKGGGAQYTYEMTKALISLQIPVVAIITSTNENLKQWKNLDLEKLIILDGYTDNKSLVSETLAWRKKYAPIIKKDLEEYHVTCICVPMITFWTKRINDLFKTATTVVVLHDPKPHSGDINKFALRLFGEKAILKNADAIIVLSKLFIDYVEEKYDKKDKVFHIPHGPLNIYKNIENKVQTHNYSKDSVNFLFFGTISKYKGIGVLAEAYQKVYKLEKDITLTIAGSGDFSLYKEAFNSVENVFVYNRWIKNEEVESFFKGENIVAVLPYIDATQSGVIPVCISYNVPIIASSSGGLVEQLAEYNTGILVEPNNSDELAQEMLNFITDQNRIKEMKKQIKEKDEVNSWESASNKLLDIISISKRGSKK